MVLIGVCTIIYDLSRNRHRNEQIAWLLVLKWVKQQKSLLVPVVLIWLNRMITANNSYIVQNCFIHSRFLSHWHNAFRQAENSIRETVWRE
jgi:hypothetical protein